MKKRITFLLLFVLLVSFVFASCGENNTPNGNSDNASNTQQQEPEVEISEGKHSYDVDGITLTLNTNVDKYIRNGVFYLEELAHDLGWHTPRPEQETNKNQMMYRCGENDSIEVCLTDMHQFKPHMISFSYISFGSHVNFMRYDEDGCYTIHEGGDYTTNYEQIVVMAYIMEVYPNNPNFDIYSFGENGVWTVYK